jgi:hypothetical protein
VTIKDHRLKTGTLTIDALPFASQATNVNLEPKTDEDGDRLEVLSGETVEPDDVTTWDLNITSVQDFDDPAGFIATCLDQAGEVVPFVWQPNATGVSYAGTIKLRPVAIGGDVATRLDTDASFPVITGPTPTYPV